MTTIPTVDAFFERETRWHAELAALRAVMLDTPLGETLKWRQPCYVLDRKNVAIIGSLTDCCVLSFFKGALLSDPNGVLDRPGENTQLARMIRFTDVDRVVAMEPVIRAYVDEAIAIERSGRRVAFSARDDLELPDELRAKFAQVAGLQAAFEGLTAGRRREYVLHFTGAKQSATRRARIERCVARILDGKSLRR